jgi:hypothetical protein
MASLGAAEPAAGDQEKVGRAAEPAAGDQEKVGRAAENEKFDRDKELAEDQRDSAQEYRTRVEAAQLPEKVRKAALREVGNLELTSPQSPESGDIRAWLDTILDVTWSTTTRDSIAVEGELEVDPTAADRKKVDTDKVDPAATGQKDG